MTNSTAATQRLTVGQAVVRFMIAQHVERDGLIKPFFGGALGIFGHGNVAGIGQALLQYRANFRYFQGRNEQGMVHIATGYAKARNRLGALAVTTSIGPGATNMITGAATATVNRLPVLLLPSDIFATRRVGSVLQQIENPWSQDTSANDAFKAVSKYFDRINRPEQLVEALLQAMRVLTSPSDTGAVTLALPQDVQAEAWDFPARLFADRIWHVARPRGDRASIARAADIIRSSKRPIIIAGGGVIYSDATESLRAFTESTGIPVGVTQAGKASLAHDHDHELALGPLGASGSKFANAIASQADVVVGIGTRYTDFTSASNTLFREPGVRFVNINVTEFDAQKESATAVVGDARETLDEFREALAGWEVPAEFRRESIIAAQDWREEVDRLTAPGPEGTPMSQAEVIGIVNRFAGQRSLAVNAAGSMPGDLHRLWRASDPKGYDLEYGNSCMGYEIPGAIGAKLADPDREVFCFIGDGSWLMLSQEILTAVQENLKLTVLLVDNQGYGSIDALSRTVGSQGFGTRFQHRDAAGQLDGDRLAVDFAANAASYGAAVFSARSADQLRDALDKSRREKGTTVIYVEVDSQARFGGSGAWWEVPVAQTADLSTTNDARGPYESEKARQQLYL
jgi:Acetolactate synthase